MTCYQLLAPTADWQDPDEKSSSVEPKEAVWTQTRVYKHRISGLLVASDLALTGAACAETGEAGWGDAPDVTIAAATVPVSLPDSVQGGPTWSMRAGMLLLRAPGVARFALKAGRTIDYEPEPGAAAGDIAAFVLGSALGIASLVTFAAYGLA